MNNRYFGAALMTPLLIFLYLGGALLKYIVLFLALIGMHEFYMAVKRKNMNPLSFFGYALCILYYYFIDKSFNFEIVTLLLIPVFFLSLCIPIVNEKYNFIDVSITITGFLYIAVFFSFIVLINGKEYGEFLVWLIFLSSWTSDTFAYYIGKNFGKHKLSPKASPKKTIEGAVGGLIGSTLISAVFGMFLLEKGFHTPLYHFLILGFLCSIWGQFGDLVASSIKRFVEIKDFSDLIPGHGGILDRFDSILFVSVGIYYYMTFVMGI